jgi:hypothetical protein
MNRALWDTVTESVVAYPRADDLPVIGLDEQRYQVLTIVREAEPEPDAGFLVVPTRSVDLQAGEWVWGWEQQAIPPDGPDYQGFYEALLVSSVYGAVLTVEATGDLARALAVFVSAIQDALNGRVNEPALQGAIWLLLGQLTLQDAHLTELQALMADYGLADIYSLAP